MSRGSILEKLKINWGFAVAGVFLLVTFIGVCVYGENLFIAIHDHLDGTHTQFTMLKDNRIFFSPDAKVPMLGGLDRNLMPSEFKLYSLTFMLLPAFEAMVLNWYLRIFLSILGFFLLSRLLFPSNRRKESLAIICGLLYGIFPSFVVEGISFASLPILLYLMILLYRAPKKRYYLFLLLFPVLSDFVFFGFFICGYLILFFLIGWVVKRKPAFRMLFSLFVIAAGFVLTEWRLFYSVLVESEPSIRESYAGTFYTLKESLIAGGTAFLHGTDACDSEHIWVVLPTCAIWLLYESICRVKKHRAIEIIKDPLNWIYLWIAGNAFFSGFEKTAVFQNLIDAVLPPLSGFGFSRTLWFNPFLWYFAFFIVLGRIGKSFLRNLAWILATLVVLFYPHMYNPIVFNIPGVYERYIEITGKEPHLSYGEFYSEELFDKIKKEIGYQGEWSVAYGMHPAVLQYNGIATLDGYFTLYPLSYKEKFREIIAPELAVDDFNRAYFDDWGGRAYLFSTEIGYQPDRTMNIDEADLLIDPEAFRNLEGTYIFSRVMIRNADALGFQEIGCYLDEESPYKIYVYKTTGETAEN